MAMFTVMNNHWNNMRNMNKGSKNKPKIVRCKCGKFDGPIDNVIAKYDDGVYNLRYYCPQCKEELEI